MNAPFTMNGLLYVFGVIIAIVAGITAIIAVVKWINGIHDKMKDWDNYSIQIRDLEARMSDRQTDIEAKLQEIKAEQYVLTSSMLAVLDGLKQLNCNGNVTRAYNDLESYINEKAHD